MSKIKELPLLERPREKLLRYGIDKLSDEELLAIIIRTGYKGKNAKEIAHDILSSCGGLANFPSLSYKSLLSFKGISETKAISLLVIIEIYKRNLLLKAEASLPLIDENYLVEKYSAYLRDMNQETVIVICLDRNKKIIHEETLFKGNEHSASTSIKEIIRVLLDYNSKSFYIIHNHPSGLASPSMDDILFTENLILKAKHFNIKLLDHLIIGNDNFYSFKAKDNENA